MEGLNMEAANPWLWVIEALLHMKQVDVLIILELIKSAPHIAAHLDRNVRELLSIRILEDLYAREVHNGNSSVPPPESRVNIDPSYFCQDVVNSLLELASPINLGFNVAHILELDVPCFILQKRSGIQNCFLHQMKIGILEGSNPILKKLKDGSGLEVPNEDSGIPIDVGASNGIADKHGLSGNTKPKRKLTSLIPEDDEIFEENLPVENENLSLAEKDINIVVSENCEVVSPKQCGTLEESLRKLKRDLLSSPKHPSKLSASVCQHEQSGSLSLKAIEHVDEPLEWETGPQIQPRERSGGKEDICVDASARLKANNDVDPGIDLPNEQQFPYISSTTRKKSGDDDGHTSYSEIANGGNECALELPPVAGNVSGDNAEENISTEANTTPIPNFQDKMQHAMSQDKNVSGDNLEISSDRDEHIAVMKNDFLSSQGIDTQDSLGTLLNSCVKCNKGGNLLVCTSISCPVLVHQECLVSVPDYRNWNFYCPFCAYSRAISRNQEAEKKFSLHRAELIDFHLFKPELGEKSPPKRFHGSKKHGSSEIQNMNEHIEPTNNHDSLNKDIRSLIPIRKLNVQVGEPSKSGLRVQNSSAENEKSLSREPEIISGNEMHNQLSEKKELPCESESGSTCAPESTDHLEKTSDAESEKGDTSKYCIKPRKQGRKIMEPAIQLRRKALPWTNVEEQTLKEGVRRFSTDDDKTIPWKKIWEFGADVFQQRRNPIDLKEKWRNICKGSPKSK